MVAAFYRQNRNMGDKNLEDGSIVNHIHRGRHITADELEWHGCSYSCGPAGH